MAIFDPLFIVLFLIWSVLISFTAVMYFSYRHHINRKHCVDRKTFDLWLLKWAHEKDKNKVFSSALFEVISCLGPTVPNCGCRGCNAEMSLALCAAKEAINAYKSDN